MVSKIIITLFIFLLIAINSLIQTAKDLTLLMLISELVGFILWPICLLCSLFVGLPYLFAFSVSLVLMGALELILIGTALVKTA